MIIKIIKHCECKVKLELLLNMRLWISKETDKIRFLQRTSPSSSHDWYQGQLVGISYIDEYIKRLIEDLERSEGTCRK